MGCLLLHNEFGYEFGWIKNNRMSAFPIRTLALYRVVLLRSLSYVACFWSPNSCPSFYHYILEASPLKTRQFTFGCRLVWENGAVWFLSGYQRLYQMLMVDVWMNFNWFFCCFFFLILLAAALRLVKKWAWDILLEQIKYHYCVQCFKRRKIIHLFQLILYMRWMCFS